MKVDICENISEPDLGKNFCRLQHEVKQLKAHLNTLDEENEALRNTIGEMKATQNSVAQNISQLCNTAKNELQRQDMIIAELRQQLDETVFRRYKRREECDREQQVDPNDNQVGTHEGSENTNEQKKLATLDQHRTPSETLIRDHMKDREQNRHGSNLPQIGRLSTTKENAVTSDHWHLNSSGGNQESQSTSRSLEHSTRISDERHQPASDCSAREPPESHSKSPSNQITNISMKKYCSYDRNNSTDAPSRYENNSRYNLGKQFAGTSHRERIGTISDARLEKSVDTITATENNQRTDPSSTSDVDGGSDNVKDGRVIRKTAPSSELNSVVDNIKTPSAPYVNKAQLCCPISDVGNDEHTNVTKVAPSGGVEKAAAPASGALRTSTSGQIRQKLDSRPISEADKYKQANVKETGSKTSTKKIEVAEKTVMPASKSIRTSTSSRDHRKPSSCPISDVRWNSAKGKVSGKNVSSSNDKAGKDKTQNTAMPSSQQKAAIFVQEKIRNGTENASLFDDIAKNNETKRKVTTRKNETVQTSAPTVDKTSKRKEEVSGTGLPIAVSKAKCVSKDDKAIGDKRTETKNKPTSKNVTKESKSSKIIDKKGRSSRKSDSTVLTKGNSTKQTGMNGAVEKELQSVSRVDKSNQVQQGTQNEPEKPFLEKSCSPSEHREEKNSTALAPNTLRTVQKEKISITAKRLLNKIGQEEKSSNGVKFKKPSNPVIHPQKSDSSRILQENVEIGQHHPESSTAEKIEQGDQHMLKRYLYEGKIRLHVKDYDNKVADGQVTTVTALDPNRQIVDPKLTAAATADHKKFTDSKRTDSKDDCDSTGGGKKKTKLKSKNLESHSRDKSQVSNRDTSSTSAKPKIPASNKIGGRSSATTESSTSSGKPTTPSKSRKRKQPSSKGTSSGYSSSDCQSVKKAGTPVNDLELDSEERCCKPGSTADQPSSFSLESQQVPVTSTETSSISEASARVGLDPLHGDAKSEISKTRLDTDTTKDRGVGSLRQSDVKPQRHQDSDLSTQNSRLLWTRDEDKIILQTSQQHSDKKEVVQLISQLLPNRSVVEIKHRFEKLLVLLQPTSSGQT